MSVILEEYWWSSWHQPVFTNNNTWGTVSASASASGSAPFHALDSSVSTEWSSGSSAAQFTWTFPQPLKIYRIVAVNLADGSSRNVNAYADSELSVPIATGQFTNTANSVCRMNLSAPVGCEKLFIELDSYDTDSGLSALYVYAESGTVKLGLEPYLNTESGMTVVSDGYNDDGVFQAESLAGFKFNGGAVSTLYISSNHYIGFDSNGRHLNICQRDGCSMKILKQSGTLFNGMNFLKIRFDGYTVYNQRTDANKLTFEFFQFSNNDMYLHVIQTPRSNTGYSALVCGQTTIPLTLADGTGAGKDVCFYCEDLTGSSWNVQYERYEKEHHTFCGYLVQSGGVYYTVVSGALAAIPEIVLTAGTFLEYAVETAPASALLVNVASPSICCWQADETPGTLKADVSAIPIPQTIESVIDMSHGTILKINTMTAQYTGNVGVRYSLDEGETFSSETPMGTWLTTDVDALFESLPPSKILIVHFILHSGAALSRFKITYINREVS